MRERFAKTAFGRAALMGVCAATTTVACLMGGGCARPAAPPSAASAVLQKQVSFVLPSNSGALVSVPLANTPATVLDAWAPTCKPCRQRLPALSARKTDIEARGAKLVLVAVLSDGESTEEAKRALASWGVREPFLVDHGNVLRREADVSALPATLVLDARGVVRWVAPESATADDVVAAATSTPD